jgi:hypothetical protein
VIVHPVGAEVEYVRGLCDAGSKSLLCIRETQRTVLAYERTVDVVDILRTIAVLEVRMEDHHGPAVHDEANLPPERTV